MFNILNSLYSVCMYKTFIRLLVIRLFFCVGFVSQYFNINLNIFCVEFVSPYHESVDKCGSV